MANPLSDTRRKEMAFKNREDGRPKETKTTKPGEFMRKFAFRNFGSLRFPAYALSCLAPPRMAEPDKTRVHEEFI